MLQKKKIFTSGNFLIICFLAIVLFASSLGLGLSLARAERRGNPDILQNSSDAATPEDYGWGNEPPWPLEFVQVAAGDNHSLAITTSGDLYSFGYNDYGQLGLGNTTRQSTPQPVMSGITFASIAAGGTDTASHSLAITDTGALYSFGCNDYGQLGIGTSDFNTHPTPQPVMSGTKFKAVAAASGHSLAITTTGDLYSFGYNDYGQLGIGNKTDQSSPQLVMSGTKFSSVAAGYQHSLAITTTGDLYSFGRNDFGQLGIGTSGTGTNQSSPSL